MNIIPVAIHITESAVSLTMMTDSLHSQNSNPRNRGRGLASRGLIGLF